jgi:glucose/mannose-6-phosphate isomerase
VHRAVERRQDRGDVQRARRPAYQASLRAGFQAAVGTDIFSGAVQVLANQNLVPNGRDEMLAAAGDWKARLAELEAEGKALAQKLVGKTPVVYASTKYKSVAMVWKIKLNENAKTPAFWNFFPELNHNEMVGFTNPQGKFIILMLRDLDDHPKNLKRFDVTAGLLRKRGVEVEILDMGGKGVFAKMFMSIALGDFASYYLALEYGQDPTPVDMVEELKGLLAA